MEKRGCSGDTEGAREGMALNQPLTGWEVIQRRRCGASTGRQHPPGAAPLFRSGARPQVMQVAKIVHWLGVGVWLALAILAILLWMQLLRGFLLSRAPQAFRPLWSTKSAG
jgi:hypothetical protein